MTVRFGKDGPSWTRPLGQDQSRSPFKSCSRVSASDLFRMTIRAESPPSWCPAKRYVSDVHFREAGLLDCGIACPLPRETVGKLFISNEMAMCSFAPVQSFTASDEKDCSRVRKEEGVRTF